MKKIYFKVSFRNGVIIALAGFVAILFFQNCSDLNNAQSITLSEIQSQIFYNLPFAYNLKIDQISYMSCSGEGAANHSSAYTLKAGGYFSGSGVGLRGAYRSQVVRYGLESQVLSLSVSARNQSSGVVMDIRRHDNLQNYFSIFSGSSTRPQDQLMFNELQGLYLDSPHVARQLISLGGSSYLNYIKGLPGLYRKSFDGFIRMASNWTIERGVRESLRDSYYLSFTFAHHRLDQPNFRGRRFTAVRSPYDFEVPSGDSRTQTSVFGLAYGLDFQQFDGRMRSTPSRAMTIQNSISLENSNILPETWDCRERFVVVRPEDAMRLSFRYAASDGTILSAQVCDTGSDKIPTNASEAARWERIRNILLVEDWYVSLYQPTSGRPGCIVPKGNDFCYDMEALNPKDNPNIKIAYYYEESLDEPDLNIVYEQTCGPGTKFVCPHIVTLCYKQ